MFELKFDPKFGAILTVGCENVADEFDDFITENYYVFYEQREKGNTIEFLFGFAGSVDRVELLVNDFKRQHRSCSNTHGDSKGD